ncbi:hypothetical protein V8C86DRAFT_2560593 [Haematococcus lacustris]
MLQVVSERAMSLHALSGCLLLLLLLPARHASDPDIPDADTSDSAQQSVKQFTALLEELNQNISTAQSQIIALHSTLQQYTATLRSLQANVSEVSRSLQLAGSCPLASHVEPPHTEHGEPPVWAEDVGLQQLAALIAAASSQEQAHEQATVHLHRSAHSSWLQHFHLRSTFQLEGGIHVTAMAYLHTRLAPPITPAVPQYLALGDSQGRLHISSLPMVLSTPSTVVHDTGSASPITVVSSYASKRNESIIVTGHADGEVRVHSVLVAPPLPRKPKPGKGSTLGDASDSQPPAAGTILEVQLQAILPSVVESEAAPVTYLLPYSWSARPSSRRNLVIVDASGHFRVQRENGTLRYQAHANASLLAAATSGTLILGLSRDRVYVLSQLLTTGMRSYHCQGLNASFLVAAVFDPVRTYRAYAINNLAQLLTLTVPNDNRKTLCKVVRFVQLPQPNAVPGNVEWQMLAMPGYLLLATNGVVAVLNVTSTRSNPHGVVAGSLANMMGHLGLAEAAPGVLPCPTPVGHLAVSRQGNLVAALLGNGVVAVFQSSLLVPASLQGLPATGKNTWMQPVMIGCMIFVGLWQFMRAKNRVSEHGPHHFSSRLAGDGDRSQVRQSTIAAYKAALQELNASRASGIMTPPSQAWAMQDEGEALSDTVSTRT